MRLLLAAFLGLLGTASMCFGVWLIYQPAMFILAGAALLTVGLTIDFDRGGKRATSRRPARK